MENFLRVNKAIDINAMYGKEVYLTIFPDEPEGHFIYKGTLLGYGAYGKNPEHKTFCVYVDRGDGYSFDDSNIMSFISKLRKKIEPDPEHPFYILTVRGVGYRFNREA